MPNMDLQNQAGVIYCDHFHHPLKMNLSNGIFNRMPNMDLQNQVGVIYFEHFSSPLNMNLSNGI